VDGVDSAPPTRDSVREDLERSRLAFRLLVNDATPSELRRRTDGTRWTNGQLLFHMLLGFLVVRTVLPLVRFIGRRPPRVGRGFAATLNAGSRPFHAVNYLGGCLGGFVLRGERLVRVMESTIDALQRGLARERASDLDLRMPFPLGWDPYFTGSMSVLEVYHYATVHFEHHRRQLTLRPPP
jgi:hypothetical protein